MIESAQKKDSGFWPTLGWALFLGMSWTWCIGMFLPVLLVRDYGIWAWVVFAAPNVIGAAAMGWVLARPGSSERVAWAHRGAAVFFSVITIGFHGFFVDWAIGGLAGWPVLLLTPAIAAAIVLAGRKGGRADLLAAAGVFALSLLAFASFILYEGGLPHLNPGEGTPIQLAGLASVSLVGFALCPYLDLTFHRARQATTPGAGKWAFGLGFGLFFLLMICFTLAYSTAAIPLRWRLLPATVAWVLAGHMMFQAGLTIAFHWRELSRRWGRSDAHVQYGTWAGAIGTAIAILVGVLSPENEIPDAGERIYRLFMSIYALIVPAYVWLCVIPRRGQQASEPSRRTLLVFAIACALAAPTYWLAFMGGRMPWVLAGVTLILLARLFVGGRGREAVAANVAVE